MTSEGEVHTDLKATIMARSMGASMARGLGILLIMMTLSEIAATRAARRLANKQQPHPMRRHTARRPPFKTRAAGGGAREEGGNHTAARTLA